MLTKLRIRNFKSWHDTGDIPLAPITVLFGSNSAGKSSIIQFLLMLKQTIESPDRRRVLHPGDEHTPVDLGTFRDLVYTHNEKLSISFDLQCSLPAPLQFTDPRTDCSYEGRELRFEAAVAEDPKTSQVYVENLEYALGSSGDGVVRIEMAPSKPGSLSTYKLIPRGYKLVRNQGRPWLPPPPVRF